MSGKMLVIYPNGQTTEEDYSGDEPPLESLQAHVQGYIEAIPGMVRYKDQLCVAYVNEEGLLRDLPVNHYASRLVRHDYRIVGNMVVIVPNPEEKK